MSAFKSSALVEENLQYVAPRRAKPSRVLHFTLSVARDLDRASEVLRGSGRLHILAPQRNDRIHALRRRPLRAVPHRLPRAAES